MILGTGTPLPDPDRAGPSVSIVVDSAAYWTDAGPGAVHAIIDGFDSDIRERLAIAGGLAAGG